MHKSFKTIAFAGSAMAFAMTGGLLAAQEQMPAPAPGETTETAPQTASPSMPDTAPTTGQEQDQGPTASSAKPADTATTMSSPTAEQDAMMQSWPADRQAGFKAWPAETQSYFWSLTKARQDLFWALSDSDKVTLSKMPEAQRESTWAQIESQVNPPRR